MKETTIMMIMMIDDDHDDDDEDFIKYFSFSVFFEFSLFCFLWLDHSTDRPIDLYSDDEWEVLIIIFVCVLFVLKNNIYNENHR